MPTYQRCDECVEEIARDLLREFETHVPLIESKVKIDFVFAFADVDDQTGARTNNAITKGGAKCLGLTRKIALKDRALGRGDAEITLDGDWWAEANDAEKRALLDHELHHIAVKPGKRDDLMRPILWLRQHDVEVGWFNCIAARHGAMSMERQQASKMMSDKGQFYWPDIFNTTQNQSRFQTLEVANR